MTKQQRGCFRFFNTTKRLQRQIGKHLYFFHRLPHPNGFAVTTLVFAVVFLSLPFAFAVPPFVITPLKNKSVFHFLSLRENTKYFRGNL
jgi:hypothetical protein